MTDNTPSSDLPAHWSEGAKSLYDEIVEENPNLPAIDLGTVYEAAALIAQADAASSRVGTDGLTVPGSTGQMVAHPLLAEARMCRVQALAALRSLGVARGGSAASAAGSALAIKRHHPPKLHAVQ